MKLTKSKGGGSKKFYTGFFSAQVVAINPVKADLYEMLGIEATEEELSKEIEYTGEDKDKNEVITFSFWVKADTSEQQMFNVRIRVKDKESVSEKSGKSQYVNQSGSSTWVNNEKDLAAWFTNFQDKEKNNIAPKVYRKALQGEAGLYDFLRPWLGKVDFFKAEANSTILIENTKRAFRNVDKFINDEFRPLIDAEGEDKMVTNLTLFATVYVQEKDGEVKYFQNIYPAYLPSSIKDGSRYSATMNVIRACESSNSWDKNPVLKKYIEQLEGEYGCKDIYEICSLKEIDPSKHQAGTNTVIQSADGTGTAEVDDASY